MWAKFKDQVWQRFWKSQKTTIIGIIIFFAGELLAFATSNAKNPTVQAVLGLVSAYFISHKEQWVQELADARHPSTTAPSNRGFALMKTLIVMAVCTIFLSACSLFTKNFGNSVGSGIVNCTTAELKPAEDALLADLSGIFATALTGNLPALLIVLENDAKTQFGPIGLTALKCDAQVLASGWESMHSSDAGVAPSAEMRSLLVMSNPPPSQLIYLRAKDYASTH